jgi:hypothetical protein
MPTYNDALFDPPAPFAFVSLRNPKTKEVVSIGMLIDTGADVTLIPQEALNRLGIQAVPDTGYELAGFAGEIRVVSAFRLEMIFCRKTFRGNFLPTDEDWGIIGRNILNELPLLLDGPSLAWDEYRSTR